MKKTIKNIDLIEKLVKKIDLEKVEDQEQAMHLILDQKVSENVNQLEEEQITWGQKVSDDVARVAGSWKFIIIFIVILIFWIVANSIALFSKNIDPYPFILLNLILSCIAALQAPIIMMSQNRQDTKDRIRSVNDYKVNLKAELIMEDLHKKVDAMILNQMEIKKVLDKMQKSSSSENKKA